MSKIQEQIDAVVNVAARLRVEDYGTGTLDVNLINALFDAADTLSLVKDLIERFNPED